MKTRVRKLVAFALVLAMLLTVMPAEAFAVVWSGWRNQPTWPSKPSQPVVEEPVEEPAAIVAQPEDVTVAVGGVAAFTVATNCAVKKYQWQQKLARSSKWINVLGRSSDTLTVAASYARNGYQYRCVVTLPDGKKLTSAAAKLTVVSFPVLKKELKVDEDLTVSVDAEKGAFPEGTAVTAEEVDLDEVQKAVDAAANISGKVLYAADITFSKNGEELQPVEGKTVKVSFSASDLKDIPENAIVVHIDSETKKAEPVETINTAKADEVTFKAKKFSIYAVLEPGSEGDKAQLTINFYGYKKVGEGDSATYVQDNENPIVTYYVKNDDPASELEKIVTDPGAGQIGEDLLFRGWSMDDYKVYGAETTPDEYDGAAYTKDTKLMTAEEIRTYLKDYVIGHIKQGDELNFYAGVFQYYNITYFGNTAGGEPIWYISLGTDTVLLRPDETEAKYKVDMHYSVTSNQNFKGWIPTAEETAVIKDGEPVLDEDGQPITLPATADNISPPLDVYPNGTEVTLSGDVVFGIDAPVGFWLVYNGNGKGATYNAPQFYLEGQTTKPAENADPEANPIRMKRNGYTFQGWYKDEACTDGNEFTFGGTLQENTNIFAKWEEVTLAPYTVVFWTQNQSRTGYDVADSYKGENGSVHSIIPYTVQENGDEDYVTGYTGMGHYTGFCLKETSKNQQIEITPEGDAVLNLYYDRIVYNFKFYLYKTGSQNNRYDYANNSGPGTDPYANNNNGLVTWHTNQTEHPGYTGGSILSEEHNGRTYYYFVMQAYYGEDISAKWPKYNEITGANGHEAVSFVMMVGTKLKPNATNQGSGTVKGIISTLNENILGATNDANGNYVIIRFPDSYYNWRYHIWFEAVNGVAPEGKTTHTHNGTLYYEDTVLVVRSSNTTDGNQNEPKYPGFTYITRLGQNNNGTVWEGGHWTTTESGTTLYHLNYVYDREVYKITYMDGEYVTGKDGNHIQNRGTQQLDPAESALIQQGATISDDIGNGYVPTLPKGEDGYVFDGWYVDEGCTAPYTFDTMPVGGITVHAKWRQVAYRVFLHPNADFTEEEVGPRDDMRDYTLSWGDERAGANDKQQMNFSVPWGDKISLPFGTRKGYEFTGWVTESGANYMPGTELNNTTVPAEPEYDKTTDMTDIMDKFGHIIQGAGESYWISNIEKTTPEGYTPSNSDATRDFIERKLDLYGTWRKVVEGSDGVKVQYDAGEFGDPESVPTDPLFYKDKAPAIGQDACQVADAHKDEYKFLYWVVQKWDKTQNKYVDATDSEGKKVICYPGDTFKVYVDNAKAVIHESHEDPVSHETIIVSADYTLQLRAEYGEKEAAKPTFFHWFRNWDGDDELDPNPGPIHRDPEDGYLQINEPVDIYTLEDGIPEREGYLFLGWAREAEFPDNNPNNDPYDYVEVGVEDLYLKWIPDATEEHGGHYEAFDEEKDKWVTVTQVAADEAEPYQAWYAVWAQFFEVAYSHDRDNVIKVPIIEGKKYNLVDGVEEKNLMDGYSIPGVDPGYLYGGYYNGMPAVADELDWDEYTPYTEDGRAMTPTAGTRYNVKEVDKKENYLRCIYRYTYKIDGSKKLTWLCVLSSTDDDNYNEIGFTIDGVDQGSSYVDQTVSISNAAGTETVDVNRSNFNGKVDEDVYAQISYHVICDVGAVPTEATTYVVRPYWITKDGVKVSGPKERTLTIIIKDGGYPVLDTTKCKEKTVP